MATLTDIVELTSNETRLRIIVLLTQRDLCSCRIHNIMGISKKTARRHLKKLLDKGVVKSEKRDNHEFYMLTLGESVVADLIASLINNIDNFPLLSADQKKLIDQT
jgi:ArsR family transcriptional regulator